MENFFQLSQTSEKTSSNTTTSKDSPLPMELKIKRRNSSQKSYKCPDPGCKASFLFKSELTQHVLTHPGSEFFVCPYDGCNKGFKRLDTLRTHFRLHTGEKPFACQYKPCGMSFATKAALRYHSLKHSNEKSYKCNAPDCGKSFLTLGQLKQHEKWKCCAHSQESKTTECPSGISKEFWDWLEADPQH